MSEAFVWFQNSSENANSSASFYEKLLDWKRADGPPGITMFATPKGPFAAISERQGQVTGWVPYVEVADVTEATSRAKKLGAVLLQKRTKGPAGDYTVIKDPGGATLALWQKA
jgi:predicted enzyme related to lactoylglutathione lyase